LPAQVEQLLAGRQRPGQQVNLAVIVNSPLKAVPRCTDDHVLLIALRTSDVWTGERSADTLELLLRGAADRGWTARYVLPDAASCEPVPLPDDYFNQAFLRCEFEHGRQLARQVTSPWRQDLPGVSPSVPANGAPPHPCPGARNAGTVER
jgi:hypothetical protein